MVLLFFKKNQHRIYPIIRFAISIAIAFFITKLKLDYFEFYFHDLGVSYRTQPEASKDISIIYINSETVQNFKGVPNAKDHLQILKSIAAENPRVIVYNMDLSKLEGNFVDKAELAKFAETLQHFYIITNDQEMRGEEGKLKLPEPFERLRVLSGPRTMDKSNFAKDHVTRRFIITYQDQLYIHPLIASFFNPDVLNEERIRGKFNFVDSEQAFIHFNPKGSFQSFNFSEIYQQKFNPYLIHNRLVLIGEDLGKSSDDYILTPYSRQVGAMTNTEMHANIFETLIQNKAPIRAPSWINMLFTLIITTITIYVVLTVKPGKGIAILVLTSLTFGLIVYFSSWLFGYWLNMAQPLLAIFVCYYFFIPYRLIVENRKSWEYYQKNKLLTQVEELKTNFISMMSHDLKTPLARIQGMTEIISRDKNPLSSTQQEALETIQQSGSDLIRFISTILKYGQIESQQLELHLESRDINELLKEVIKKSEFLAKLKHIQIIAELEPLFSIKVDPELIKQVFSNLIENAIKYSPENTKVLITSEESDNSVIIQFSDQGQGISQEELNHIFMKFFRSKNAKASPIKGSGLGLYLSKYFVELHKGNLTVESELGQGSTFTVELPMQ